jgi:hypothetical protein
MTTLHAFDIPEDDALLPNWLEEQLAGPHLGELVAELEALQEVERTFRGPGSNEPATLNTVLGNRLSDVQQRGLSAIPPVVLRRLFRHPELLNELQNEVLSAESAYWDQKLAESDDLSDSVGAGWNRLALEIGEISPTLPMTRPASTRPAGGRPIRWYFAGLATAAAITVAAFVAREKFPPQPGGQGTLTASTGWGWSKPNAFPRDVSRTEYLNTLADQAEQWSRKRPETPQALALRINEFRQGCSQLLLSDHKPLPPPERKWLVEKCRLWAGKLDASLAALEAGTDVPEVRKQVDQLVDKLTKTLRDEAAHPTAA